MRVLIIALLLFMFVPPVSAQETHICPMHPHIHGEAGDNCPVCGMPLVPMVEAAPEEAADMAQDPSAIFIENTYRQALGVKTAPVALHEFGKSIHAYGHIAPSTRLETAVAVRTSGWVVDLATDAAGDTVKKGDLLFTFYSPDLMTAQADFLQGGRVGNAEQRLRLFGMGDQAIAELKKAGRFLEATPFYAPADGTVAMLNVRTGAYLEEGGTILTLQDYSEVWVTAHLPLRDLVLVEVGTHAVALVDDTGARFDASVDYIYPNTDPQSREGMVRLVIDNADGRLKTDALVTVMFEAGSRERLAVPEEAVLYGDHGAYVIEALGDGYFRPVMVMTGITAWGMIEIVGGLEEGQDIVMTGQFMIDAESNLRGGMAAMGHDHGDMKAKEGKDDEHKH